MSVSRLPFHRLLPLLLGLVAVAPVAADEEAWTAGRSFYDEGDYAAAAEAFSAAVSASADESRYHHWLGKAYGRLAERASWWRAVGLARKTRESLERAVALDPDNLPAVEDLADFYDSAPAFLGGDAEQADELRRRIRRLQAGEDPVDEG